MTTGHVAHVRKLYKLILRLHRSLPAEFRLLGDSYAKEEFRLHKKCKPGEARIFLNEWQDYASTMLRQVSPTPEQPQDPEGNEPRIADEAIQAALGPIPLPRPPSPRNEEGFILRPTPRYINRHREDVNGALFRRRMYHFQEFVADKGNGLVLVPAPRTIEGAEIQEPSAQAPSAQAPNAQAPNTQASNDQVPNAQAPNTQASNDQVPNAQAPNTQASNAQAPNAQASNAQAPNAQAPNTQASNAQVPNAQAPNTQASNAQAPNAQASNAQAPNAQVSNAQALAHVDGYNPEPNGESDSKR